MLPLTSTPKNAIFHRMEQNIPDEPSFEHTQKELHVLYEVSCAMRMTLELKHILYIILTGVTSHSGLGYNRALLFLPNPKSRSLECKMAIGPESGEHAGKIWEYIESSKQNLDDLIQAERVPLSVTDSSLYKSLKELKLPLHKDSPLLLTKAYHRGTPWHLSSKEIHEYSHDPLLKAFKTNELIIMPLRTRNTVNGLIVADNIYTQKSISEEDIKIFTMLANQAGLAIENSHLYEMVVHKSHTDSLTELWNHGFFQEQLIREIQETQKAENPLSLLMIDVDNFKKLNDDCGHQHGDVILKELARILKESSREVDYVCRYGGEEFSMILGQTQKEQALDIAQRLRKTIADHPFPRVSPHGKNIHITVSIGLAAFPQDASTPEELITQADKAMYIAKFSGKNKINSA